MEPDESMPQEDPGESPVVIIPPIPDAHPAGPNDPLKDVQAMRQMNEARAMGMPREDMPQYGSLGMPMPVSMHVPPNAAAQKSPAEEEMLRRTLLQLLQENESLRGALHEGGPASRGREQHQSRAMMAQHPMLSVVQHPMMAQHVIMTQHPNHVHVGKLNARALAIEKYRLKRKRRLAAPHLRGPRYEKMKIVAQQKTRGTSGKFMKKEDRLKEEAAAAAAAAAATAGVVKADLLQQ